MSADDGVVVTGGGGPPSDNTKEQDRAEAGAQQVIKDLDAGRLITKRTAVDVKKAAERAIGGADLSRGLEKMP